MRPAGHLRTARLSFVIICCQAILEFILQKKVRNSSWWWGAAFPTCLSFSPFVYPLLIAAPSGWNLLTALALVTSPPANTCWLVRLWNDFFFCFVLFCSPSSSASLSLYLSFNKHLSRVKKKKKGTFKKFIWSVVGQWQNNWLWIYNSSHRSLVKNGDDKWAFSTVWRLSLPLDLFLSQTLWPTCLHCSWWFEKLQVHKVSQPCQISQSLLWISYK